MSDVRDTTSAPPPPGPPPRPSFPRLTRSTDDKVVSGLCGGLGRHFGVDPVVFRIAFVVLGLAGGSGALLYLVGWLMVPDDRSGATVLDRARHGHPSQVLAAVLIGVGAIVVLGRLGDDGGGGFLAGLVLLGVGAAVLWSRRDGSDDGPQPVDPGSAPGPGGGPVPPAWAPPPPQPLSPPPAGPEDPGPTGTDATAPLAIEGVSGSTATVDRPTPPAPPPPLSAPPAATTRARARRPRSALVPVTLSLVAILAGVLALLGASDTVDIPVVVALAVPLLVIGGALCVGAWWGRARLLIPVGVVLGVGILAAAVVDVPIRGGVGDRTYRPRAVSELQSPYRLAAGDLVVDLGAVDLTSATRTVEVSLGAGDLEVVVPDGPEVVVDFHSGAGSVSVFGRQWDGMSTDHRIVEPGREGEGRLVLEVGVGFGDLEVRRASP